MKIISFVKSLLPRIDKESVLEDIEVTKSELNNGVLGIYDSAEIHFKVTGIKSKRAKEIQNVFYRNFSIKGHKKQSTMVGDILQAMRTVKVNLDHVESQVEDLFNRDIIRDGLTIRKSILLRAAEHISFITRYSVDLINLLCILEAEEAKVEHLEGFSQAPKLREMVEKNVFIFAKLLSIYGQKPEDFKSVIVAIPDAVLNDTTIQNIVAVYKEEDVDPMNSAVIQNFQGNPIYHVRLVFAEWQANRYKAFKDKKKMLELRLLHLRMQQNNENDPGLEKEIAYLQDRVENIEYKLKKMED